MIVERCDQCPLDELDTIRHSSDAGRLLDKVLSLDFAVEHFQINWQDVSAEQVKALQVLKEERIKHDRERQEEDYERRQEEMKIRRAQEQLQGRESTHTHKGEQ